MILAALSVAVVSAVIVRTLVHRFRVAGIVDEVGVRSSHARPTPRGGGLGFVVAATTGWIAAAAWVPDPARTALVGVIVSGLLVASVGFLDDLRGVPALGRLLVHLAAAGLGLWAIGCLQPAGPVLAGFAVISVAWCVNAFNFMDGTDAFAATHGVALTGLLVILLQADHGEDPVATTLALGTCAALAGFLPFNWPRARIFMGDVGSGWLGLTVALSLVASHRADAAAAVAGLAWLSPFLMDPTVCLVRRASRGERVWKAHRSHGFQNLSRRLGSHGRLLAVWWSVSLFIYLPLAWLSWRVGWWPWLPIALAAGVVQALVLRSGVPGVAEQGPGSSTAQSRH